MTTRTAGFNANTRVGTTFDVSHSRQRVCVPPRRPLPGRETLFTKNTVMEQERTEQGPDAFKGDSAQTCFPSHDSRHEWDPRQRRPDAPNTLLTCRRGGNPWRSPVCLNGDQGPVSAWGPCCSPRRATRLVCPSCALVSGGRRRDGVRTRARSHSLCLPLSQSQTRAAREQWV